MANEQNLIPGGHRLTKEEQSRAGKKSGETRRAKANARKALEMLLNSEVATKNGETVTGMDALIMNLYKVAIDPKSRNNVYAAKTLLEICGQDISPLDQKRKRAEIKMLESQIKKMDGVADNPAYDKLDSILKGLGEKANVAVESETK